MNAFDADDGGLEVSGRAHAPPDSAGEGFFCLDLRGRCTFANPAAGRMLGYEPGELLGAKMHRLVHHTRCDGSPYPEEACPVRRTLRTGEECRVADDVFWRKNGDALRVGYSAHPAVQDGEVRGAVVAFVGVDGPASGAGGRGEDVSSRYAAVVEATTDFVGMADRDGRVLSINGAGREMVGAGRDEDLSGTTIADYHPTWARNVVLGEGIPAALREGTWSGETALLARDGREIPVSQVILAHRGPDGEVRFLSTTARDITDRKRAEEELAESRRLFESIAEATPDLLYVSEFAGGSNVYANRRVEKILGYTGEQLAALGGATTDTLVHPEDRARVLASWAGIAGLDDGEVQEHEFRARHADGSYRWLRARNVVLSRAEDGGVRRVLGLAHDVTGDRRSEEERGRLLEAAERRAAELDAVIRNMPDAVYVGDQAGISVCNDAALEMLGFESVEELNQHIPLLAERLQNRFARTGERIPPDEEPFARALAGETAVDEVVARNLKTGRDVVVRSAAAPILRDGRVVGAVAVNTDITEQKESEERLTYHARLLENLREAVVATDTNLAVTAWNLGAEEIFGWTAADALGRHVGEVIPAEFAGERVSEIIQELEDGGRYRTEVASRRKDGTPVYVEGAIIALRDGRGRTTGYLSINRDTTERRRAEEALRESNARIENILESVTDAFYAIDAEWRFTYLNERAVRFASQLAGEEFTREGLLGKTLWETLPAIVGTPIEGHYRRAVRERQSAVFEYPYPGGGPVFEVHAYPSGRGLSIYFQDITERKRAEEALRDSQERFRALAAATFEGSAVHENGVVLEANDALARMFGYEPWEVVGRSALELAAPESRDLVRGNIASGYEGPYEAVGLRKDGTRFEVEIRGRPFEYKGRAVRATAIRDVTERKRGEAALKNSERRFRAFFETAAVGAAQADPTTGRFLEVNERLCRFLGYDREELLSLGFPDVTHPDDRARDRDGLARLTRGEIREYLAEKRYVRKDGRIVWGLLAVSLLRDADGRALHTASIVQDVTERRRVEEALMEIREAERRRMARDLHDAVLQDLAAAVQAVQATQEEARASVGALEHAAEALRRATRGLRGAVHDLRLEEGRPFVRTVESLVDLNRQLAPEIEVTLEVREGFPAELPVGVGVGLLRIVQEALVNVRRHSDAGRVRVNLGLHGDALGIDVSDDGRGFDPAANRGRGVGLVGMEERARELGGELEVRSAPGEGTRVSVRVKA